MISIFITTITKQSGAHIIATSNQIGVVFFGITSLPLCDNNFRLIVFVIAIYNTCMYALVAIITAIYDSSITECQPFVKQTIPTDFICFSNKPDIITNNWKIDITPYHKDVSSDYRVIHKYYKMMTHDIIVLRKYATIIWIENNVEIINKNVSKYILKKLRNNPIISWHHPAHYGNLHREVDISYSLLKYSYDIKKQYQDYVNKGYNDIYFKGLCHPSQHFGVWFTSFVAYNNKDCRIHNFLKSWFREILHYGTNDIISFSYVCYKNNILPYALPDANIIGEPTTSNQYYIYH